MKAIGKVTLHAHGRTWVKSEGQTAHMTYGDTVIFVGPCELNIEVEHPELLRTESVPHYPGLFARLRRFYWGVRKAWRESV